MHSDTADDISALAQSNTVNRNKMHFRGPVKKITLLGRQEKKIHMCLMQMSVYFSPGRMELALILCVSVTMNSDDADCWARRV